MLSTTLQKFYQSHWPDIPEETIRAFVSRYETKAFKKGDILIEPGQVCDWTGLVTRGIFRYFHRVKGKEHIGQFYFPGTVTSDYVSYTTNLPSRLYIDCIQDGEVAFLKKEDAEWLKNHIPGFLENIIHYLNAVYIANFERSASLLLDSAEERYLRIVHSRPELIQHVPMYMIASFIGISPEALSRIRHKLAKQKG